MMREISVITTSVDVPATADVEAGFRLNFSHGTLADHKVACATIGAMEREFGGPIGILQDLQGPKIRIGTRGGHLRVVCGRHDPLYSFRREGRCTVHSATSFRPNRGKVRDNATHAVF